jgi:hypothetical protein
MVQGESKNGAGRKGSGLDCCKHNLSAVPNRLPAFGKYVSRKMFIEPNLPNCTKLA